MGNNVNTQPSKGEIYPGVDVLSFGAPVEKIRKNAPGMHHGRIFI